MSDLEDLLVDRAELDRALLSALLGAYVGIDAATGGIVPKEDWIRLGPDAKVLVYLLARKAMVALEAVELQDEGALPKEIELRTGVKGGTLRPKLVRMKSEGILAQDDAKCYFVPTHAILRAKEAIEKARSADPSSTREGRSPRRRKRGPGRTQEGSKRRSSNGAAAPEAPATLGALPELVNELLATIRSRSHPDRFEAVLFHTLRSQGQEALTTDEILAGYAVSRLPKPVNASDVIAKCFRKGHITEGPRRDGQKTWRLTGSGERHIEAVLAEAAA